MAKEFLPRAAKKDRKTIELPSHLHRQLTRMNDEKLLKGAQLSEVLLSKITVRDQVRTKFNDDSLRELAENIRVNGLIQPLVLHREEDKFVLLCGERRFRAMHLINMEKAPCFILEGKSKEELMAIQFSENSAREELHYVDKADGIYNYHVATGASERKIQAALGISKTEVHRNLIIAKLSSDIKSAAKKFNIEKYVLLEYQAMVEEKSLAVKDNEIKQGIIAGLITKRSEFKKFKMNLTLQENHQTSEKSDNVSRERVKKVASKTKVNVKEDKLPKKKTSFPLSSKIFEREDLTQLH